MITPKAEIALIVSDTLINPDNVLRQWYERRWAKTVPWVQSSSPHFMELPLWAGQLEAGLGYPLLYHVVTAENVDQPLPTKLGPGRVVASVTSVGWPHLQRVILANPDREYHLGGYEDRRVVLDWARMEKVAVRWYDRLDEYCSAAHAAGISWHGLKAALPDVRGGVARLSLVEGCPYDCRFCTVPKLGQTPLDWTRHVMWQMDGHIAVQPRGYYLNDKTFGSIPEHYELARRVKPLAVQTNPRVMVTQPSWWGTYGPALTEIGMEVADDQALERLGKPHRVEHLQRLWQMAEEWGPSRKIVPYLIWGIPGQDYGPTIEMLAEPIASGRVPWVYVAWLSVYPGHHSAKEIYPGVTWRQPSDEDNLSSAKSWLTASERERQEGQLAQLMGLFN